MGDVNDHDEHDDQDALHEHEVRFGRLPGTRRRRVGGTPAHEAAAAAQAADNDRPTRKTMRHPPGRVEGGQFVSSSDFAAMYTTARSELAAGHMPTTAESYPTVNTPGADAQTGVVDCDWSRNGLPMGPGGGFPAGQVETLTQTFGHHSPLAPHPAQVSVDVVDFSTPANIGLATQLRVPLDASAASSAGAPSKILPTSAGPAGPRPMSGFRAIDLSSGTGAAPGMNYTGRAPGE
jgi:hypothetical protein